MGSLIQGVGNLAGGALNTVGGMAGGLLGGGGGGKGPAGQGAGMPGRAQGGGGPGAMSPAQAYGMQGQGAPPGFQGTQTGPGTGEQFYQQNQGAFQTPGQAESYSANVLNRYGQGANTPQTSNNAQSTFQQSQGLSQNLDPYYDNAIRQGNEDIRGTMAAKGAYGSSTADDQSREMVTNFRADQANREGQYGLQRAGLLGSQASAADTSSQGQSQNQLSWMQGLGNQANMGQQSEMNRLGLGFNMASGAQGLGQGREQQGFENQLAMGDRMAGLMGQTYGGMLSGDQDFMGNSIGLETGLGAEALNQDYRNTERFMSDMERTKAMAGGGKGGGKGK